MIRALTILAAIVALAVSASPASAGWQPQPKPAPSITDGTSNTVQFRNAAKGRGAGKVAKAPTPITAAGLAPDFGISLSLRKAPPKPPRLASRSGGEVISADAYVRAPRTVVTEKIGTTH